MAITPQMPTQPTTQATIAPGPNVDFANNAVKGNQEFFTASPALGAAALVSGNQTTVDTLAAVDHFVSYGQAIDDHIATYNSNVWFANALKNVPDVAKSVIPNAVDKLMGGMNQ
jgi:hypothetical protein